jgi:hypothetical protein
MAIAMGLAGTSRAEAADVPVLIRIRTNNPVVARLIQEATERSATFPQPG